MQTIRELIEALEDLASEHGDETPVRIAYQPSYPLAARLRAVTPLPAGLSDDEDGDPEDVVVWLAASDTVGSDESPYAPRDAWEG
jgi:hypothetical protein